MRYEIQCNFSYFKLIFSKSRAFYLSFFHSPKISKIYEASFSPEQDASEYVYSESVAHPPSGDVENQFVAVLLTLPIYILT